MSYLTGVPPTPMMFLIETAVGDLTILCRILGWVGTVGRSYWNNRWQVNAIMSYLTGASPRQVVLIGTSLGGPPRLCRLLRVGPDGWFLLAQTSVGHRNYVLSYG